IMLIIADLSDQIITCFLGGSFRAKKSRAHIVVDSNNTRALLRESFDRFRADQSRRSSDNDCAHLVYSTIRLAITQDDGPSNQVRFAWEASKRNPGFLLEYASSPRKACSSF